MSLYSILNSNEDREDVLDSMLPSLPLDKLTLRPDQHEDLPDAILEDPWATGGAIWLDHAHYDQRLDGVHDSFAQSTRMVLDQNSNDEELPDAESPPIQEDADDSSTSVSSTDANDVCYGMIYRVDVKLVGEMAKLSSKLAEGRDIQALLLRFAVDRIYVEFSDETQFGFLRENMTLAFNPLRDISKVEFEAIVIAPRIRKQIDGMKKAGDAIIQVDINIYGPRSKASTVGETLSKGKAFLQRPDHYRRQLPYENPHFIRFADIEQIDQTDDMQQNIAETEERTQAEMVQDVVAEVQRSLHRAEGLQRAVGDQRLRTDLLEHQEQGLTFMHQRESGEIPDEFRLWEPTKIAGEDWFVHKISGHKYKERPDEMGGGILADEMGMGKSLAILAIVMATLDDADKWARDKNTEKSPHSRIETYSYGTLVVVPSALLINSWLNEIEIHLDKTLKVIKYHGSGRKQDLLSLASCDVIITTYHTLAMEFGSKDSPIHKIGWYRVVLDEAHTIRRPATTFYRTCNELEARSRWCLTGTPIQNRLEDIGALFAFLKADPFHNPAQFRKDICIPFEMKDKRVVERLRLLYDSMVLRRTKDVLSLPGFEEYTTGLELTEEERKQYDHTTSILDRNIRNLVGAHEIPGKFGLFQATMQLRILCNHGTYQKQFSWKQRRLCEEEENEALIGELGFNIDAKCVTCQQPRPILGSTMRYNQFAENCHHMICAECLEIDGQQGVVHCPLCQLVGKTLRGTGSGTTDSDNEDTEMIDQRALPIKESERKPKIYFNKTGRSTKIERLVEDVKEDIHATKSIIFSCWTKTLDLIERLLKNDNIRPLRIDGDSPLTQRQRTLDQFARDSSARVMLMTTGTGAFGLNLTAANRIFIVELQWNPSVENQAIARAIRLRQSEKVIVRRYIMRGTVEEEMQSQQIKKRQAANAGFAR